MRYYIQILIFILILAGCATPPGQLKESDFIWQEKTISANYQEVYRNVKEGFRACSSFIVEADLYLDLKRGHFDILLESVFTRDFVLGMIEIKAEAKDSSYIKAGILNHHEQDIFSPSGEKYRRTWLRWASGDPTCS